MKMKYLDGSEADDPFFDKDADYQRAHIAAMVGCSPDHPQGWPTTLIDGLIDVRRFKGKDKFYIELGRTMSPMFS